MKMSCNGCVERENLIDARHKQLEKKWADDKSVMRQNGQVLCKYKYNCLLKRCYVNDSNTDWKCNLCMVKEIHELSVKCKVFGTILERVKVVWIKAWCINKIARLLEKVETLEC